MLLPFTQHIVSEIHVQGNGRLFEFTGLLAQIWKEHSTTCTIMYIPRNIGIAEIYVGRIINTQGSSSTSEFCGFSSMAPFNKNFKMVRNYAKL